MIRDLFSVGAHVGYSTSLRHPAMSRYVYGRKGNTDIIDLHRTAETIDTVSNALAQHLKQRHTILFVGGKSEAQAAIKAAGQRLGMPYVAGRWVGGTITNFKQIRQQVDKLERLREQKEKGELGKYTKREQLSFDREIADLERYYDGLIPLTGLPHALFVVDPKQEYTAVHEAYIRDIPVYALANTDCSASQCEDIVPANDNEKSAIDYVVGTITERLSEHVSGGETQDTEASDTTAQENEAAQGEPAAAAA